MIVGSQQDGHGERAARPPTERERAEQERLERAAGTRVELVRRGSPRAPRARRRRASGSSRAPRAGSRRASACPSSRPLAGGRGSRAPGRSRGRPRARLPRRVRRTARTSATTDPTSGSRRPRKFCASGPHASVSSTSCRPRWTKPREVAPGGTVLEVELHLPHLEPVAERRRSSCGSRPRSRPRRGTARRARRPRGRRWPESGSRMRRPPSTLDQRARDALRDAEAAARRGARTLRSRGRRPPSSSGRRSPRRSASQRRSGPSRARPLGERECLALPATRKPDDPCARGLGRDRRSRRASRRRRRRPPRRGRPRRSAATVPPIRSSSSRAATSTVSRSLTRRSAWVGRRIGQDAVDGVSGRSRSFRAAHRRAGTRARPARWRCRSCRPSRARGAGRPGARSAASPRTSTPTDGIGVDGEAAVETREEVLRLALLGPGGAGDDDGVERRPARSPTAPRRASRRAAAGSGRAASPTSSLASSRPSCSRRSAPARSRSSDRRASASSTASVSSGTRSARISATRPPASATARRTVPATPWSTEPTKTTPTVLPSSRSRTRSGYAVVGEVVERLPAHVRHRPPARRRCRARRAARRSAPGGWLARRR